ncbi:hypothetical protein TSUD_89480 [Trifolium subterraneum]|uniref:Uncharacterized protein n=1 Tax=Trifolium subterraneum TaxID=3900 RepID=A0A2Z6M459_TRISU|nr:hypothetical protein TSUD_89480 [Trifolium subterraneum]
MPAEPGIAFGLIRAGVLKNATAAEPGATQSYLAAVNWSFLLINQFVESRSQFQNGLVNNAFSAALRAFLLNATAAEPGAAQSYSATVGEAEPATASGLMWTGDLQNATVAEPGASQTCSRI